MRSRFHLSVIVMLLLLLSFNQAKSQLIINEFMASNSGFSIDPDYDESADWIEIYNSGAVAIQLNGYYLTDNISDPTKWQIKSDVQLQPGAYLVIWADGMDAGLHTNFKLTATGEELAIVSPDLVVIDSLIFGNQETNISMGRKANQNEWVFYTVPTPGMPNSADSFDGIVKSSPDFSVTGGIYRSPVVIKLSTLFGGTVRYTLDGSVPNENSPLAATINISKNTVVRARIFKDGQLPGPVSTHSYFIDPNYNHNTLPIVSIATAPENLWDANKGIYVQRYKPDWEIPVNIELFENDGSDRAAFNLGAGVKVNGLYSWKLPQKMLGVYFKKEYGAGKLDYPIIFDKKRKSYDDFALRASGSDWTNTMFRDGFIQNSTMGYTNLDNSGFRACIVYFNGEYMGIHNIREKIDEDYIVGNHGLKGGTFDMVEETDHGRIPEVGDAVAYNHIFELAANDLTIQANWDKITEVVDIENFTDFVCTEVYSGNGSINHNVMAWKPNDSGKWKWILMDLDRGFGSVHNNLINYSISQDAWPFSSFMKNEGYKHYFGRRLADHLFTTFNPDRIIPLIDRHAAAIAAEIPYHIDRWKGTVAIDNYGYPISSVEYWEGEVDDLRAFATERPDVLLNDLTRYGFNEAVPVSVDIMPQHSGSVVFNGIKLPVDHCEGAYPQGEELKLVAESKAGYTFKGWKQNGNAMLIPREEVWRYSDIGALSTNDWKTNNYADASWKTGKAEFGYGDNDETTVVGYGASSSNKYITTYFRKNFSVEKKDFIITLSLQLKCDDGAVVYLNGTEITRFNLPAGEIGFATTALEAIGSGDESLFRTYNIPPSVLIDGNNVVAVEVHQSSGGSSDLSFDLELSAYMSSPDQYLSTSRELTVNLSSDGLDVSAIFESDGKCIVPEQITDVVTLKKECSPYLVPFNVEITKTGKLIVEPGVEFWFSNNVSIISSGPIDARGTKDEPILFRGNPEESNSKWGAISLRNVTDTSRFSNVIIEDAGKGPHPVREVAALSCFHSVVMIDSITITDVEANPIHGRYSDIRLTNSTIHSKVTGDGINIKYGKGYIDHCEFIGNDQVDSDGIDYDDVTNGIIKNTLIHDFYGDNSDAIDIGEKATGLFIDSMKVYSIFDKGTSVGQRSSATITNSVFENCNYGAGLKDSSRVVIDKCTYYGNNVGIAVYEKNPGDAGANVKVSNTILSNSYTAGFSADSFSTIAITHSGGDTEKLPEGGNNVFGNPLFANPVLSDFTLMESSPYKSAGVDGEMGAGNFISGVEPKIMISAIAYLTDLQFEDLEFVGIYNPSSKPVSLNGYQFTKGITFTFPDWLSIGPGETCYITSNTASSFWDGRGAVVFKWESGRLADEGEAIQLVNKQGMIVDQVIYNNKKPWPVLQHAQQGIVLSRYDVDNHFAEYWKLLPLSEIVAVKSIAMLNTLRIYPNPSAGRVMIDGLNDYQQVAEVFNLQGKKVKQAVVSGRNATIDLSALNNGIYLIHAGEQWGRIVLTH